MLDPPALTSLQELLQGKEAVDIFRKVNANDRSVTWLNPGKTIADHVGLVLPGTRCYQLGSGYQKLNTGILADPTFFPQVCKLWENWQRHKPTFQNLNVWWDKGI